MERAFGFRAIFVRDFQGMILKNLFF